MGEHWSRSVVCKGLSIPLSDLRKAGKTYGDLGKREGNGCFLPLVPEDMKEEVKNGEWFCLGALAETEEAASEESDVKTAAGVLLFSSEDGVSIYFTG